MPSTDVTPTSDVTTTGWANSGSGSFSNTLATNGGAGDGTHEVNITGGTQGSDTVLIVNTGFSVAGITAITSVSYTVRWEASTSKSAGDFLIELWNSAQTSKLAHMASQLTTTSTSQITSGPTNLTLDDTTVSDWTSFRIKLFSAVGASDTTGNFFGLKITITYTTTSGGPPVGAITGCGQISAGGKTLCVVSDSNSW
jgi:hypothetical protein